MNGDWKIQIWPTPFVLQKRNLSPGLVETYEAHSWWTLFENGQTNVVIQLEYGPVIHWPMNYVHNLNVERRNHEQGKTD